MTELHLHPDGRFFIRGSTLAADGVSTPQDDYEATVTDFAADNGAAFPPLPPGACWGWTPPA